MWDPMVKILWSTVHTNSIWNKTISLLVTICSLSQNQMMLVFTPQSCWKMLNSQQEWYIQKNDRNINELYATVAILQTSYNLSSTMLFSQFLLIAQSLNEEQRCELVYHTVPKLSGVIGHWNGLLDPLFQKLKQLNLFYAQSSRCTSWITLQEGLLDSC